MTRYILSSICLFCLLSACDSPLTAYKNKSKASEASMITAKLKDSANAYFISEQLHPSAEEGDSWYPKGEAGMPVPFSEYVFPGGPSYTLTTHDAIPKNGEKSRVTLDPSEPGVQAVLSRLYIDFGPETYFRYTYTTGAGRGADATATIKAEADFKPSSPEVHTVTYELSVDKNTQEVVVSDAVVTHELE